MTAQDPADHPSGFTLTMAPAAAGVTVVMATYAESAGHWDTLVRPVLVIAIAGILLGTIVRIASRRSNLAAAAASLFVLLILGQSLLSALGALGLVAWMTNRTRNGGVPRDLPPAYVAVSSAALLISTLVAAVAAHGLDGRDFVAWGPASTEGSTPNLYIVLLDGYPRADSLELLFAHDNRAFLHELQKRSFDVYSDATSPYNETGSAILSMLSGDTSTDLEGYARHREIRRRIAVAPAITWLVDAGYELRSIAPPNGHVRLGGWDEWDSGNLTEFEVTIIGNSLAHGLFSSAVVADHRDRVLAGLDRLVDEARSSETPRLVFAHFLAPHPPFLHSANGELQEPPACWPDTCLLYSVAIDRLDMSVADYSEQMARQVSWTNEHLVRAIDKLVAADPDAAVVILSDHGARYSRDDREEQTRTLLAARTPGQPELFAASPGPMGLVQTLLRAYVWSQQH
jgi:hypothetical protein